MTKATLGTSATGSEIDASPSCESSGQPKSSRAHLCGGLCFSCPYCGKWQRQRIDYTSDFVDCHNRLCKRKLGLHFWLGGVKRTRLALPSCEPPIPLESG